MNGEYLAELTGVSKCFGKIVALDALDLGVRPGELLAILGPNGAGKTTAISLLLGLQEPDAGTVSLFHRSPRSLEARRQVGVMMQDVTLADDLRVREHVDLVGRYYPNPLTPEAVMKMTHTAALADRPYGKLSAGQKRQVQFAVALCEPREVAFPGRANGWTGCPGAGRALGNADTDAHWLYDSLRNAPVKRDVLVSRGTHVMHLEASRFQLYREVQTFLEGDACAIVDRTSPTRPTERRHTRWVCRCFRML